MGVTEQAFSVTTPYDYCLVMRSRGKSLRIFRISDACNNIFMPLDIVIILHILSLVKQNSISYRDKHLCSIW